MPGPVDAWVKLLFNALVRVSEMGTRPTDRTTNRTTALANGTNDLTPSDESTANARASATADMLLYNSRSTTTQTKNASRSPSLDYAYTYASEEDVLRWAIDEYRRNYFHFRLVKKPVCLI